MLRRMPCTTVVKKTANPDVVALTSDNSRRVIGDTFATIATLNTPVIMSTAKPTGKMTEISTRSPYPINPVPCSFVRVLTCSE